MPPKRNLTRQHSRYRGPTASGRKGGLVVLPRDGCSLPVPSMPAGDWTAAEQERWIEVWESPQASQFDDASAVTVAVMIRYEGLLLTGKGTAWVAAEWRHATESLGLTPKAMAALGWVLEEFSQ